MEDLFTKTKTYTCYRRAGLIENSEHGLTESQSTRFLTKWRKMGWVCWIEEESNKGISISQLK